MEKPDTLFLIKESQESDGYPITADKETVNEIYGHLSANPLIADYKFMDSVNGLSFARGGDLLKWTVFLDKNGNIIRTGKMCIRDRSYLNFLIERYHDEWVVIDDTQEGGDA